MDEFIETKQIVHTLQMPVCIGVGISLRETRIESPQCNSFLDAALSRVTDFENILFLYGHLPPVSIAVN